MKDDQLLNRIREKIESRKNSAPARKARSRKHFFFLLNIILLGMLIYLYTEKGQERPHAVSAVFQSGDLRMRLSIQEEKFSGYKCLVSLMSSSNEARVVPVKDGRVMKLDFSIGNEKISTQEITLTEQSIRLAPGETRVFSRYIDDEAINPAAKKSLESTRETLPQFLGIEKRRVGIGVTATLLVGEGGTQSFTIDYLPR